MAISKCGKCEGTSFELKNSVTRTGSVIDGTQFAYSFIQCRSCGTVVGVVDSHHVPSLLQKIAAKMGFNLFH